MFAFAPVNIEPVVWHHITPYLLFGGCVLMALRNLYASEHDDVKTSFHTAMAVGWMLPAVFLYETGIWYALCMGAFLWLRGRRVAAHAMGVIIVLYFVADVADFVWRHAVALQAGELAHKGFFLLTLTNMGLLGKWFLSAFFFLGSKDLLSLSRMMVRPEIVGWAWPWGFPLTISIAVGAVALAVSTLVLGQSLVRRGFGRNGPMLALCFFMALGYLAVIAVGRINLQGAFAVRVGLYYPYNFLILLLVAVALVSSGYGSWHYNLPDKLIRCFGACIIAATVVFYAATVHRVTAQMAYDHRQNRIFLAALDRYVKAHEKEPGFSFYIGPEYPGNYTADWVTRRGDPQGRLYTIAEALYFPQFTRNNPKHVIKLEH
jgi:hypothetical protein